MGFNEKKIHLIDVAEMLFAKNGYSETSIRDIATYANVNSAMISYYFGSKEKLIHAIFEFRSTDLTKLFEEIDHNSKDSFQTILAVINTYTDKVFEQVNFYKLLFQIQSIEKDYVLLEYFNKISYANYQILEKYFSEGKKYGQFNIDIDISFLISTIVGTINHIFFNQNQYKIINGMEELPIEEFVKVYKIKIKHHIEQVVKSIVY